MLERNDDPRWFSYRKRDAQRRCPVCMPFPAPANELTGRDACSICGTTTCTACSTPCRGCALLDRIRAVSEGREPVVRSDVGDRKTFHILRTFGASRDVLLSPERIVMRVLHDPRFHAYYSSAAPFVLQQILRETGIARLDRPLVARAVGGPTGFVGPNSMDALAWLMPLAHGVEVRFRPAPTDEVLTKPIEIPEGGRWALPAPWREPPVEQVMSVDGAGVVCPHCQRESEGYRALGVKVLVCGRCGRSFEVG